MVSESVREKRGTPRLRFLIVLGALSTFGPLSLDMYLPALPQMARHLHASQLMGQLTLSSCLAGLALGQLVAGPISDAVGRRRPIFFGVTAFTVFSLACALAPSAPVLIVVRFFQGLGGAAGLVVARAVVRDTYSGTRAARVFASLMLVSGLAPIIAPVFGSQLLRVTSWRGIFLALVVIGVLLIITATQVPETLPPAARHTGGIRETGRVYRRLVTDRVFMGYALATGFGAAAMFTYISASSFVLQGRYGITAQQFSAVFASNALGIMAASQASARLVSRWGPRRLYAGGLVATVTGGVALVCAVLGHVGLWGVLPALFVVIASQGLVAPNGVALAMMPYGQAAGSASAHFGVQQFLIGAAISPLAGLASGSALVMASIMVATAVLGLLIFVLFTRGSAPCVDTDDLLAERRSPSVIAG